MIFILNKKDNWLILTKKNKTIEEISLKFKLGRFFLL